MTKIKINRFPKFLEFYLKLNTVKERSDALGFESVAFITYALDEGDWPLNYLFFDTDEDATHFILKWS